MSYERQIGRLMQDAKELVSKLRDSKNPEVQLLRDRVDVCILRAEDSAPRRSNPNRVKITRIPGSLFHYVHDHPWLAIATAATLAYTLANLSTASREAQR
jgi:ElaB/YqjD/DUF883 family membrane-anchored ribosome-binding protein